MTILAAAFALLFLADVVVVVAFARLPLDLSLAVAIQSIDWMPLTILMMATNWLADFRQAIFAGIVIAILALFNRRSALLVLLGVPASIATQLLKLIFQRPRLPANLLHVSQAEPSFGFPSGHATFYAWFVPLLMVALSRWLPR